MLFWPGNSNIKIGVFFRAFNHLAGIGIFLLNGRSLSLLRKKNVLSKSEKVLKCECMYIHIDVKNIG